MKTTTTPQINPALQHEIFEEENFEILIDIVHSTYFSIYGDDAVYFDKNIFEATTDGLFRWLEGLGKLRDALDFDNVESIFRENAADYIELCEDEDREVIEDGKDYEETNRYNEQFFHSAR